MGDFLQMVKFSDELDLKPKTIVVDLTIEDLVVACVKCALASKERSQLCVLRRVCLFRTTWRGFMPVDARSHFFIENVDN